MKNENRARMDVIRMYMQGLMVVFFGLGLASIQYKLPEDLGLGAFIFICFSLTAMFLWMGRAYVKEASEIDEWEAKEKERA